ncbi:MAG: aa3-type cytochrome c oxidase subunit IV [Hyphomonadaceae bacterium]|nr:aa3-type cytochrome c oxidase subunit IV [Hyphomonadaceae bacterium]
MATGHSDYTRGDMEITAQKNTFSDFMAVTVYGVATLVVILLFPTLMFAVGLGWLTSLVISIVVGIVMGMSFKLRAAWFASLAGIGIVTAVFGFIFSLFA